MLLGAENPEAYWRRDAVLGTHTQSRTPRGGRTRAVAGVSASAARSSSTTRAPGSSSPSAVKGGKTFSPNTPPAPHPPDLGSRIAAGKRPAGPVWSFNAPAQPVRRHRNRAHRQREGGIGTRSTPGAGHGSEGGLTTRSLSALRFAGIPTDGWEPHRNNLFNRGIVQVADQRRCLVKRAY
jgi:hypothetical protein